MTASPWLPWREATGRALYGSNGFYRGLRRPAAHFRTAAHASRRFPVAVLGLLHDVDAALGHPARLDLVDVGSGGGELLAGLRGLLPDELDSRLRPVAVELAARPPELPSAISWCRELPDDITGLVIANEWLDTVPVDVVEQTEHGPRLVLVDPAGGTERLGDAPGPADRAWLDRWWPLREIGDRAEIGAPRDRAWAEVLRRLRGGMATAVDYAHLRSGRPPYGTLAGYRDGHAVTPLPDGSCDVTAHVALDACAAAGEAAGATATLLTTQREALRALGLRARRPPLPLARSDPRRYLSELAQAGEEAELIDPAGLGAFGWLIQPVGIPVPATLHATMG